jgi:hypothetical protein
LSVIGKIREAAISAPPGVLDRMVYLDNDILLYELVGAPLSEPERYADVPLKKIVALTRDDLIKKKVSWRQATSRLRGHGWDKRVLDYFEGGWGESPFPAPNSLYEFRLVAVGGICICTNGTHRLVAGKSWLVAKYGNGAVIKKAKIRTRYSLHPGLRPILERCAESKEGLRLTPFDHDERRYLRINGKAPQFIVSSDKSDEQFYAWDGDNLVHLDQEKFITKALRRLCRKPRFSTRTWHYIPHWLIIELLDDDWLSEQILSASRRLAR